ncbi:hypothetical protein ASZ90_019219 [hydrocarbon metagenome]|uniref:Uncharacterized protein n=1 Tax=hydrocarbon metagenome TaxID=938273 RepID=A0A0W8E431_9ZZZZ
MHLACYQSCHVKSVSIQSSARCTIGRVLCCMLYILLRFLSHSHLTIMQVYIFIQPIPR